MNSSEHRRRKYCRASHSARSSLSLWHVVLWTALPRRRRAGRTGAGGIDAPHEDHTATAPTDNRNNSPAARTETALVETMDLLKSRADAGDARGCFAAVQRSVALSRVGVDQRQCGADGEVRVARKQRQSDLAATRSEGKTPRAHAGTAKARAPTMRCAPACPRRTRKMVPVTLRAAQLGDDAAASCYVDGIFPHAAKLAIIRNGSCNTKHMRSISPINPLGRGNWTMVRQFYDALGAMHGDTLFGQLTGRDVAQQYRYAKLMQLGEDASDSSIIDSELSGAAALAQRQRHRRRRHLGAQHVPAFFRVACRIAAPWQTPTFVKWPRTDIVRGRCKHS